MAFSDVQTAMSNLETYRREKDDYGVRDSEPVWILSRIIKRAVEGDNPKIPTTADGWEIYSSMEGAEDVAQNLHTLTSALVEAIGNCTVRELNGDPRFEVLRKYY